MNARALALLAATGASVIYGINHTLAKGLMPDIVGPFAFIILRVTGAAILFWAISPLFPSQKIDRSDYWRFLVCALCGMVLNMNMFFKGLQLSTPINSSVVITLTPVLLLILTAVFLRERITLTKSVGIGLGLIGAMLLIFFGEKTQANAPNIPLGNLLFIGNATSYAIYLILVKPLVAKYDSITLMKYFFLIATFINLPIGWGEFVQIDWAGLQVDAIWKIIFVIVGTTFLTYLFNIYALKQLSPSTIGAFIYLQPVIAALFALAVGSDSLSPLRVGAAALIFIGVFLSTRKRATVRS